MSTRANGLTPVLGGEVPRMDEAAGPPASPQAKKKVMIASLGCVENALMASRFQKLFEINHWEAVDSAAEADILLVNTCGVNEDRAKDSLRTIESLRRSLRRDAKLMITGCLVSIDPASLAGLSQSGAELMPPRDSVPLERWLSSPERLQDVRANALPARFLRPRLRALNLLARVEWSLRHWGLPTPRRVERVLSAFEREDWHYVHVGTGCAHVCAYCAIRFAKGFIRSEPRQRIVEEVARGIAAGHTRIVLVADDTGSYGLDCGTDIAELLIDLVSLPGDFGIHVRNLEPMGMLRVLDGFKKAVASGKIRAITVPIQSGSDRVLDAMGRKYQVRPVLDALADLRLLHPDLLILTHVMVGTPGETREDFRRTLRMLRDFDFDGVAPDCYSSRAGTAADRMDRQVPALVRRWRYFYAIGAIIWWVYLRACFDLSRRPLYTRGVTE